MSLGGIGSPIGRVVGDSPLTWSNTLTAVFGAFALTGEAALFDVRLTSSRGSFVLTGENALLAQSQALVVGDFTLTGEAATFQVTLDLNAYYKNPAGIGAPIGRQIGGAPNIVYHYGAFSYDVFNAILTTYLETASAGFVLTGEDSTHFVLDHITNTGDIQLPINAILAKQQLYKARFRDVEIFPLRRENKVVGRRSTVSRLKGKSPSFTVRTDSKGYD